MVWLLGYRNEQDLLMVLEVAVDRESRLMKGSFSSHLPFILTGWIIV